MDFSVWEIVVEHVGRSPLHGQFGGTLAPFEKQNPGNGGRKPNTWRGVVSYREDGRGHLLT